MAGSTRCYMHGGNTPRGAASPHFKHGRYSRHLPTNLASRYEKLLKDTDLSGLHDEIALVTMRIQDVLEGLQTGESGETWAALAMHMAALRKIDKIGEWVESRRLWTDPSARKIRPDLYEVDAERAEETLRLEREECIDALEQLIRNAKDHQLAWVEVLGLIESRKGLVAVDTKRRAQLLIDVPIEEVQALVGSFTALVNSHVKDPDALKKITGELSALSERLSPSS